MEVQLTAEERDVLLEVLQERHREMLLEMTHTDHHHFKQVLAAKKKVVENLLEKLAEELIQR